MIFRRRGLRLAPWYATVALFWLFASVFALAFFVGLFGVGPLKWKDLLVIALIGCLVWPPARYAWNLEQWIRRGRNWYLRIDDAGVKLCLPGAAETQLVWSEIQAVTREKCWVQVKGPLPFAYRNIFYTIQTTRGSFTFSSMEIPSPARAAKEIMAKLPACS